MSLLSGLRARLRALVRRAAADRELRDEIGFHVDLETEKNIRAGMASDEARRVALARFGGVQRVREQHRDVRRAGAGIPWLEDLASDLRVAVRGWRAQPGFAAAVILTLALGIGANAAMFGIVDRMLFRPPPMLLDPAMVHRVYFYRTSRGTESASGNYQYARYQDLAAYTTSFSRAAGYREDQLPFGAGEAAREMPVGIVSASFFGFFDAPPLLGRYFTVREDSPPSGAPVVVLSYALWQTAYGGKSDVLGSTIRIGTTMYTVIGVAARGFVGLWPDRPPAAFIPITNFAGTSSNAHAFKEPWWTTYDWGWMSMIVRRRPGVSLVAADADLTHAAEISYRAQLAANPHAPPLDVARPRATAASILSERGPRESKLAKVATWVGGVALIVLLIACANVANLQLVRAVRRRREIAVRLALGVSRARLLSQLLAESTLLALLAGAAGLLIAQWGGALLRDRLMPGAEPAAVVRDPRTLLFAGAAALIVGLLTGVAPIVQATRADLASDLKAGAREGTYHRSRARTVLLLLQCSLSVVLLVGAGLFVRSLRNVRAVRLGYDTDPIAMVGLNMRGVTLDTAGSRDLRARIMSAAKAIPGVENVSVETAIPFWGTWSTSLFVQGIDSVSALGDFNRTSVSPGYFQTLGTRILRGRGFTDDDRAGAPGVMVVSDAMGKRLWPGQDAIGQCVRMGDDTMPCTYVVGIAEDIKSSSLANETASYYYVPYAQFPAGTLLPGLFVRTSGDARDRLEDIRVRLQREMPGASYVTVTPFSEVLAGQTDSWLLGATMFAAFGGLALVLAAFGLYSVIAYTVAQRTHELGVRVALGAQGGDVVRLVVRQALVIVCMGVVTGAIAALAAGRWVKPLLFEESPRDPVVLLFVSLALIGVACIASWLPARRASRVDPQVALRTE
ncbi:MAG TPA: ABC transporter permease [Gemmatimonadaceae bacterium]|nr:ABC transporter permease [Gemmatimonadaceae bacterium]